MRLVELGGAKHEERPKNGFGGVKPNITVEIASQPYLEKAGAPLGFGFGDRWSRASQSIPIQIVPHIFKISQRKPQNMLRKTRMTAVEHIVLLVISAAS